jgi:hypothetical protein
MQGAWCPPIEDSITRRIITASRRLWWFGLAGASVSGGPYLIFGYRVPPQHRQVMGLASMTSPP